MSYIPNPVHRNRTPGKSQWKISEDDERIAFHRCIENCWYQSVAGWGLHIENGIPRWLGVTQDGKTQTFIAKFVSKNGSDWHGYPADHVKYSKDVPEESVLRSWREAQLLSVAKIRKIVRGQSCNL